jgi:2'-5' RNA ligase
LQTGFTNKNHGKFSMYFLAIVCPADIGEHVQKYKLWLQKRFGCNNAMKSPAHITMIPPFWWLEEEEFLLSDWLNEFRHYDSFAIETGGIDTFGKNVLFIDVLFNPQLSALHNAVQQHFTRQSGARIKTDSRSFHPHITLATRDIKPADLELARIYLEGKISKMKFQFEYISLLRLIDGKWQVMHNDF